MAKPGRRYGCLTKFVGQVRQPFEWENRDMLFDLVGWYSGNIYNNMKTGGWISYFEDAVKAAEGYVHGDGLKWMWGNTNDLDHYTNYVYTNKSLFKGFKYFGLNTLSFINLKIEINVESK